MSDGELKSLASAVRRINQRLDMQNADIRELRELVQGAGQPVTAAQLTAMAFEAQQVEAGHQPSPEAIRMAQAAAHVRSGESVHPPPHQTGQVLWSVAQQVHKADDFTGWVFPFPTMAGHILCSTDLAEPFGVRMEVQLKDGRRWRCSYEQLEDRT
jgi:hypothetical protein